MKNVPWGLYIHLPFCKSRCHYCDFYSTTDLAEIPDLVAAVIAEIGGAAVPRPTTVDTIYVGGGTPSLVPEKWLRALMEAIRHRFEVAREAEITVEANPDSVTPAFLRTCRQMGVNRLNLGLQSTHDHILQRLGRRHRSRDARACVEMAAGAGFENLGVDLIYGVPGQTPGEWHADLQRVTGLPVSHISAYALTYEPGTPLTRARDAGRLAEATENEVVEFYQSGHETLTGMGWRHYEISNYARSAARQSKHNLKYWYRQPYWGFGPAAHSFNGRQRWWNVADLGRYVSRIQHHQDARAGCEEIGERARMDEIVMLGLRCAQGIRLDDLDEPSRTDFLAKTAVLRQTLVGEGLLLPADGLGVRPTARGMLVADALARNLLACLQGRN